VVKASRKGQGEKDRVKAKKGRGKVTVPRGTTEGKKKMEAKRKQQIKKKNLCTQVSIELRVKNEQKSPQRRVRRSKSSYWGRKKRSGTMADTMGRMAQKVQNKRVVWNNKNWAFQKGENENLRSSPNLDVHKTTCLMEDAKQRVGGSALGDKLEVEESNTGGGGSPRARLNTTNYSL